MLALAAWTTRINNFVGKTAAWLCLLTVLLQVVIVLNRYCFGYSSMLGFGLINYEEALLYMFSAIFLFGAAYTYNENEHVRVDIFYAAMSDRRRQWVDFLGNIFLLMPLVAVILIKSNHNLTGSWNAAEGSRDGGLPIFFLFKSMLPIFAISLGAQGMANVIKLAHQLFGDWTKLDVLLGLFFAVLAALLAWVSFGWATDANWVRPNPNWRFGAYTFGVWFVRVSSIALVAYCLFAVFKSLNNSQSTSNLVSEA